MSEIINYTHNKILLYILVIPFLLTISACGNKGPLTVPEKKIENPVEQQETKNNSY